MPTKMRHCGDTIKRAMGLVQRLRSRRRLGEVDLTKYRMDVVAYVHDILGQTLTPQQEEIANAYLANDRLLVPSGNSTGKSFLASCLAMHNFDCYDPGLTLVTAPNKEQLKDIIFKELRSLAPGRKGWQPRACELFDAPNHWIKGYTAKDATGFHGRHDAAVLVIFDEAEGIDAQFWDAALSMATKFVCFYNPTNTTSAAAAMERSGQWKIMRLSALEHPNIAAELEGRPLPVPNAVKLHEVKTRLKAWATEIIGEEPEHPDDIYLDGVRWRLGPVAQARIAGIRPTNSSNSVFSERLWQKINATVVDRIPDHWPLQIGADMAREGNDFFSVAVRRGKCCLHIEKHNGWGAKQIVARLQDLCNTYANTHEDPKTIPVVIDGTGGYGGGVVDYPDGYRFIGLHGGWKSDREDEYTDVRSQLWFDLAELANCEMVDLSRLTPQMKTEIYEDLMTPGYSFDRKGRRQIHNHETTKKRLGRSPDLGDALSLAYAPKPAFFERTAELR